MGAIYKNGILYGRGSTSAEGMYYDGTNSGSSETTTQGAIDDIYSKLPGKADLDQNGKVLTSQLPSYVDDVLEYSSQSNFPGAGESGKIYVDLSTNKTYRWSGSTYTEIAQGLALGETSGTAYAGNKGKKNADDIADLTSALASKQDTLTTANAGENVTITEVNGVKKINSQSSDPFAGITASQITAIADRVFNPVLVTNITITGSGNTLTVGDTIQLSASVLPANVDDNTITWSSSDTTKATVSSGLVTGVSEGNVVITATANDESGVTGTYSLSVQNAILNPVQSIKIFGPSVLEVGESESLRSDVLPYDAEDKSITWTSSNNNVVTVGSNGSLSAVSVGNANITATANDGSGVNATKAMHIVETETAIHPYSIEFVIPEEVEIKSNAYNTRIFRIGTPVQLGIQFVDGGNEIIAPANLTDGTYWFDYESQYVSISNSGLLTPIMSTTFNAEYGDSYITVYANDDYYGNGYNSQYIEVRNAYPTLSSIDIQVDTSEYADYGRLIVRGYYNSNCEEEDIVAEFSVENIDDNGYPYFDSYPSNINDNSTDRLIGVKNTLYGYEGGRIEITITARCYRLLRDSSYDYYEDDEYEITESLIFNNQ